MAIPKPGEKVRGSQSGSPINAVFDLLGRRWSLGVVWNLEKGPMTFRDLQAQCGGISPSILNQRIKDLKEADVVERTLQGYQLTARGEELRLCLLPLGQWSFQWAEDLFQFKKEI